MKFLRWVLVGAMVALPVLAEAQEATLRGTVSDTTGAALPGVTVQAEHEASGNKFVGVTDQHGDYRLPVRVGKYRLTAELAGFGPVARTLELLVGQEGVVNLQMAVSSVKETITVTGEAPLLDVTQSRLGGNIDSRQMEELPVNGRNWLDLVTLAPGSRLNQSSSVPNPSSFGMASYQINVDGQAVAQFLAPGDAFGQARYSRDSIAEFELLSRFDATQGRSSGVQINVVTKSGTNVPSGTFASYFRDSKMNAKDFVAKRVLPYSDQQLSSTFGGPIVKDKVHFFANYEFEREPQTLTYNTPYPRFNVDQTGTKITHLGGVRMDAEFSPKTRLSVRGAASSFDLPFGTTNGGATVTPSQVASATRDHKDIFATLTHVVSDRTVNELRMGYNGVFWTQAGVTKWTNGPASLKGFGAPRVNFNGFRVGSDQSQIPQDLGQDVFSARDDLTYTLNKGGRHTVKLGGEYLNTRLGDYICVTCIGIIDATGGPIPSNIEDLFPDWTDANTWNLAAISPLVKTYTQGVGDFSINLRRQEIGAWLQDDWAIGTRLTLNLGVRYDLGKGLFAEDVGLAPFIKANRPLEKDDVAPRFGFAYTLTEKTVIRGGLGRYYAETTGQAARLLIGATKTAQLEVPNDGRPDFAANPFNGPIPTLQQALSLVPKYGLPGFTNAVADPKAKVAYSDQLSIGMQRQLGDKMAVEADYVRIASRNLAMPRNMNQAYNPATGANYPFSNLALRPYQGYASIATAPTDLWDNYHALQTSFTRRFANQWQASATYTLSRTYQGDPQPLNTIEGCQYPLIAPGVCNVPFEVTKDLGGDPYWTGYTSRANVNGTWTIGHGLQVSGLYFYRNGILNQSSYGTDLRGRGIFATSGSLPAALPANRLRPDGTIVPRNNFKEKPLHRADLRIEQHIGLGGRRGIDGMFEVFNVFNHANYGSYVTTEVSKTYGSPTQNTNVAFAPRTVQLGFRVTF